MSDAVDLSELQEPESESPIDRLRHSCAHIMAHAVQRLWPDAKFGIGPTITNGFYYDIDLKHQIVPEDLPKIEAEMKKIIGEKNEFVRSEHSTEEAIAYFEKAGQKYKVEIIQGLAEATGAKTFSFYQEGDFTDLCRGPHIANTKEVKAFKLLSVAGAYWRGDEKNPQLQRLYGTAFFDRAELKEHLRMLEEAKKRDHRKLGKELDLFFFQPEAPASPFFFPKGAIVYNRLVQYVRDMYVPFNYEEVITPQILDVSLWHKSGHYENYKENMYFTNFDEREYAVKPMNCPTHAMIFGARKRSYRDLPIRMADFGRLHRYEKSGATHGLTRVRTFAQDDAHIFCTPDQIKSEINSVSEMIVKTFELFGFKNLKIYLSTRPAKRVGADELWDQAETSLKEALQELGKPFEINPGDGAFYGPKIDYIAEDAIKREHQLATIQLDFNLAKRFDVSYIGADNSAHTPVVIHRAVLGSIERFMGVLIEHLAGAFPFWLAPVQTRIISIKDTHNEYCQDFFTQLKNMGLRPEVDDRNESMGLKTREAQKAKIPFMLVAGDREVESGEFSVRKYGEKQSTSMKKEEIIKLFKDLEDVPHRVHAH